MWERKLSLFTTFHCLQFPDGSTVSEVPPSLLAMSPTACPGIVTTDK